MSDIRMKQRYCFRKKILSAGFAVLLILIAAGGTSAYLTAFDFHDNVMAVGHNTTEITEEFPEVTPIPVENDPEIRKAVQVSNLPAGEDGFNVDCFVRISLGYSNYDIGKAVVLKNLDTTNWEYCDSDGYYYYKTKLREGEATEPLFTAIQIDSEKADVTYADQWDEFEIQIYEESISAEDFSCYQDAWNAYSKLL